ncbi:MAG: nitroreductase family protein [Pseudomonadales bacterium]|jgi:nitroreductase|nr:nitroreductase family protein [Pseudomonadales bacterium]MDG1443454.1 nitroreductase family protein [Pseudomonadales bacterium]
MDIYEAMSTLRAVRRLKPDPIDEDIVERIFTAATWAPTGGNMQPWRMIKVTDPAKKQALEDLYRPHWESYIPGYEKKMESMPASVQSSSRRALEAGTYLARHLHEVPVIAVFCYNPSIMTITDADQPRPSVVGGGSVYPAVQNFLLACRNEGLGCVLTTLLCIEEPSVKKILEMPEDWFTCAHVPVGYPVLGGHGSINRKPLTTMMSENTWGNLA